MRINRLFKGAESRDAAGNLYRALVAQSRLPAFYRGFGVPDTLDGRFDMIALHAFLVLHRLKRDGEGQGRVAQALFDLMFADMDGALRELGVGDLSVGRKVKRMASGFYGRVAAYEAGLAGTKDELQHALARNLYGTVAPAASQVAAMASYVRRQAECLARAATDDLLKGKIAFLAPEEASAMSARP